MSACGISAHDDTPREPRGHSACLGERFPLSTGRCQFYQKKVLVDVNTRPCNGLKPCICLRLAKTVRFASRTPTARWSEGSNTEATVSALLYTLETKALVRQPRVLVKQAMESVTTGATDRKHNPLMHPALISAGPQHDGHSQLFSAHAPVCRLLNSHLGATPFSSSAAARPARGSRLIG